MNELLEILGNLHPEIDFTSHNRLIDDKVLDSFDIVTLVADINDRFGVAIPVEELVPDNFNSALSIQALIDRLS